ncbi:MULTISPECIES: hypothetical protein [Comamonas]|uniref:hypothetical protein n=1 Tax=Comamonas TaxID=283 RepID=UPI0006B8C4A0|nr:MULTISPECIES: hypothetical protein [Comamonas]
METIEQMADRHIRETEASLDHIDLLMKRAQKASAKASDQAEIERLLEQATMQREKLDLHLAALKEAKQQSDLARLVEEGKSFRDRLERIRMGIERLLLSLI